MSFRSSNKPEIEISSEWGQLLTCTSSPPKVGTEPFVEGKEVFLLNHVFSTDECELLIGEAEKHGFGTTNYPKLYRGNLRLMTFDLSLTSLVWTRIQSQIPIHVQEDGKAWESVGLNPKWRLAKYFPGDKFGGHIDATFCDYSTGFKSMFTVNIYMNEGFIGGETSFDFREMSHRNRKRENKDKKAPTTALTPQPAKLEERIVDVVPRTGLALIFRQPPTQNYIHEGKELISGLKYLFRSDVMYKPL